MLCCVVSLCSSVCVVFSCGCVVLSLLWFSWLLWLWLWLWSVVLLIFVSLCLPQCSKVCLCLFEHKIQHIHSCAPSSFINTTALSLRTPLSSVNMPELRRKRPHLELRECAGNLVWWCCSWVSNTTNYNQPTSMTPCQSLPHQHNSNAQQQLLCDSCIHLCSWWWWVQQHNNNNNPQQLIEEQNSFQHQQELLSMLVCCFVCVVLLVLCCTVLLVLIVPSCCCL